MLGSVRIASIRFISGFLFLKASCLIERLGNFCDPFLLKPPERAGMDMVKAGSDFQVGLCGKVV